MIKIGILGASDIAFRRMVPALYNSTQFEYIGVAIPSLKEWGSAKNAEEMISLQKVKAQTFQEKFGGKIYESYESLLKSDEVTAVYIPLPPGLHYKWGSEGLKNNKHILLEKPFTTCLEDTRNLLKEAEQRGLAVHENFAFLYHKQIETIEDILSKEEIGELRLIRAAFGFPYRGENDFRYHKAMGGGALLDCGGYPLKLADHLLGGTTIVSTSFLSSCKNHDVDVFGSATLKNRDGQIAQIAFGMDNSYKCDLEIWGSKGYLSTKRVFTPTAEMQTQIIINNAEERIICVQPDDQFLHSAEFFAACVQDEKKRKDHYKTIEHQAELFEVMINKGGEL